MKFAESLQSVPHLSIKPYAQDLLSKGRIYLPYPRHHILNSASADGSSGSLEMVQLYWRFVNAIKGARELDCDARFVISQPRLFDSAGFVLNIKDNRNMELS